LYNERFAAVGAGNRFFKDLNSSASIDLENIVYYRDETHYFVMTAKKHSLLYRGVLLQVTLVASHGDMIIVAWEQQQPFNGLFSRITWVSRYQKGKTNLDFTGARDSEWQWHQLGHMQVCTSLQTDNHANTPPLVFYRPDAVPAAQPTASKH